MGASELSSVLAALEPIIEGLVALGVPGLIALLIALPTLSIVVAFVAAFLLNHRHAAQMRELMELYREDTRKTVEEVAAKHAEVVVFYRNNASLVKNYEKLLEVNQQLIVNNTRAMEHLSTIIEARR
ncbi:transcriptional regulator [uncultured Desulfovibrio sp.]|uniref:transcriptional regulator n=1 Tax=uncultured Desulfovibrio sp. TaxID=167968 RepID=UPI00263B46E2|nr:transcriptional regulator [uncultured Desulfovibrio sp.]